jgi:anthranilate synthase/aminodeoxychorismate synthase-like glutamine amidotransferase
MLLLIDNYDSFTYNLYQYVSELGEDVKVVRNNEIDVQQIEEMKPVRIVISPGPSTPQNAGISCEVIKRLGGTIPMLGVCLGHQCIGDVYGGIVSQAKRIMHGKSSMIYHNGSGVFAGLPVPFSAIRYHSLLVQRENFPECLEVTAWTDGGEIMGVRHKRFAVEGVQFHPESFMTEHGKEILKNFLRGKN